MLMYPLPLPCAVMRFRTTVWLPWRSNPVMVTDDALLEALTAFLTICLAGRDAVLAASAAPDVTSTVNTPRAMAATDERARAAWSIRRIYPVRPPRRRQAPTADRRGGCRARARVPRSPAGIWATPRP